MIALALSAFGLIKRYWFVPVGIGVALALVFGVRSILRDARNAGRAEIREQWNADKAARAEQSAQMTAGLVVAFNGMDRSLNNTVDRIFADGRNITINLDAEIKSDARYSSPGCSLTDGVFAQLNAARSLSPPTTTSPGHR